MTVQFGRIEATLTREFEGWKRTAALIAKHPDYPGKREAIEECIEEIVERSRQGRLSPTQRAELLNLLLSGS